MSTSRMISGNRHKLLQSDMPQPVNDEIIPNWTSGRHADALEN